MILFSPLTNVFVIALFLVFGQVNGTKINRITKLTQNTTLDTPKHMAKTTKADGGAPYIQNEPIIFKNDGISNKENYTLLEIMDITKTTDPFENVSNNDSFKEATIMESDTEKITNRKLTNEKAKPSAMPSAKPSAKPSSKPSAMPSSKPSAKPLSKRSAMP
jgi:hypothetical protein